jgi:hypothetical protein
MTDSLVPELKLAFCQNAPYHENHLINIRKYSKYEVEKNKT